MRGLATSTLLDENLTCEFKRKIHSISPSHVWKLSAFFIACEKAVFIHIWIQEPEQKAKENFPVVLMQPSLKLFSSGQKNCAVFKFIFAKKLFNQHKLL